MRRNQSMMQLKNDWNEYLHGELHKPYFQKLKTYLEEEYAANTIFPPREEIFRALELTSFADTKVVILGQDPYHEQGQAHGLCFSVRKGITLPPSLRNIYKELQSDVGISVPDHGDLTAWGKQGVLLLNTVLTVREGHANSHQKKGWETFTDAVISALNQKKTPVVFLLWGANAQKKADLITNPLHVKLNSVHPSPLSAYRGFLGCKHFSQANEALCASGQAPIDWQP